MALEPDQTLGRYRVIEKIGAGGMGEVWVAEDTRLKRRIALKTLPSWTASDDSLRARFEREAQTIAALNHPNSGTIHAGEEEGYAIGRSMERGQQFQRLRVLGDAAIREVLVQQLGGLDGDLLLQV